jgi:hypothetical protein
LARREDVAGCTVHWWMRRGSYDCILDSYKIGGIRYTTEEAFQRFIQG